MALVWNGVLWLNSWHAVPPRNAPTAPCTNNATSNSGTDHSQLAPVMLQNAWYASSPVTIQSPKCPTACRNPCQSLHRINSRMSSGSTWQRYQLILASFSNLEVMFILGCGQTFSRQLVANIFTDRQNANLPTRQFPDPQVIFQSG